MLLNFARQDVVTVSPEATVREAAGRLDEHGVGCLVVTRAGKPVGILTDRDIVVRVVSCGRDPDTIRVEEVMSRDLLTLDEELGLFEALETMKDRSVRRFPVVDADGNLSGIFTVDDVVYLLGLELSAVARIIEQEAP